jgi:hypothetical protein
MTRIGWTATLAAVALLVASCRPTGPQPSNITPARQPTVTTDVGDQPGPAQAVGRTEQAAADEADREPPKRAAPKTSEGRVLGAIGRALSNSVKGEAAENP